MNSVQADTAVISQVQRFSVGDGPGIRTTVFFKGCNLHCPWCHNPETISPAPQLLFYAARCTHCGRCARVCLRHRVTGTSHDIDRAGCAGCGRCAAACPAGALSLSGEVRPLSDLLETIREDADFYAASGGGVTLSGGEPLLQAAACASLAAACRAEGFRVLLDTAGCVPYTAFERLLPFMQLCYFDLKAGTQAGYDAVGGRFELVQENLRRLAADGVETVVRIPLIPGFNDTPEEARRIAAAAAQAGVTAVNLLPFHRLGSAKYAALGQPYAFAEIQPPAAEKLEALLDIFRSAGLAASKGG